MSTLVIPPPPDTAPPLPDDSVATQVRAAVETALRRGLVGLEYLSLDDMDVGVTPKDVLHARGAMKLYRYRPLADEVYRLPLLIVTSLASKPYILDLTPGQSLIEYLLRRGFDVYLIDWGIPRKEDAKLRLEDYALDFIPDCVDQVLRDSGVPQLSILGYCLGGTLAAMYAALHPNAPLANLACLTTPINYEGMGPFRQWTDRRHFDVDRIVDTLGNVPPEFLLAAFDLLRPAGRVSSAVQLWDRMQDDQYVRSFMMLDRWAADQIPFPGECFRQITKELFWENKLQKGTLTLAGRRVDLGAITVPLIHILAEHDHIVPYAAAKDLVPSVGSADKQELVLRGGHASLVAGGNAIYRLWPQLDQWLSIRSV